MGEGGKVGAKMEDWKGEDWRVEEGRTEGGNEGGVILFIQLIHIHHCVVFRSNSRKMF